MQGEISSFLHTGRVVMCASVEVWSSDVWKCSSSQSRGAMWEHRDWGSACACADSWGFALNRKILFLSSVLIPHHVGIRSEGGVWGCTKDNGQGLGARMMSPSNVCNNQHNWSVILSQPVKSFLLPRILMLTALNFIMTEKHKARLFFFSHHFIHLSIWANEVNVPATWVEQFINITVIIAG